MKAQAGCKPFQHILIILKSVGEYFRYMIHIQITGGPSYVMPDNKVTGRKRRSIDLHRRRTRRNADVDDDASCIEDGFCKKNGICLIRAGKFYMENFVCKNFGHKNLVFIPSLCLIKFLSSFDIKYNGSQLKNLDNSGAIFTLSLSILILNSQCVAKYGFS